MKRLPDMIFDSMSELAAYFETHERARGSGDSTITPHGHDWTLGLAFEDTLAHMRGKVWSEGVDQIVHGFAEAPMQTYGRGPAIAHDVAGFFPDVPAMLAGQPDCMLDLRQDEQIAQSPIVTVGFGGYSGGTDSYEAINRGIAILALVDALEAGGRRVELWSVWDNDAHGGGGQKMRVRVKDADAHWSPHSAVFSMAHPAWYRHGMFRLMETQAEWNKATNGSYGSGRADTQQDLDVNFPYYYHGWASSLRSALKHVQSEARKQGLEVDLLREAA